MQSTAPQPIPPTASAPTTETIQEHKEEDAVTRKALRGTKEVIDNALPKWSPSWCKGLDKVRATTCSTRLAKNFFDRSNTIASLSTTCYILKNYFPVMARCNVTSVDSIKNRFL